VDRVESRIGGWSLTGREDRAIVSTMTAGGLTYRCKCGKPTRVSVDGIISAAPIAYARGASAASTSIGSVVAWRRAMPVTRATAIRSGLDRRRLLLMFAP